MAGQIPYNRIARSVALRANQIADADDAAALDAQYTGDLADDANMDGMEVPYTALKDTILAIEKRIAERIAKNANGLYRSFLRGLTDSLESGDELPTIDTDDNEFIGVFGAAFDDDNGDNEPLTEATIQEIRRINRNQRAGARPDVFQFKIVGTRLYHTRGSAYLEGCVYNDIERAEAYDQSFDSPDFEAGEGLSCLPTACEVWWIAEVLEMLPQEDWYVAEAQTYGNIARKCESEYRAGVEPTPTMPDPVSRPNPVTN